MQDGVRLSRSSVPKRGGSWALTVGMYVAEFWEPFFLRCDANNLLSQLWTWAAGDISDNAIFKGDFEAALRAIKARMIILPAELDRYFPAW